MRWPSFILRWLLRTLFGLLWLVLGILIALQTETVRGPLTRWLLETVNHSIKGQIEVSTLSGDLLNRLELQGIELSDANGETVATVARVAVQLDLGALLYGTLRATDIKVDSPKVFNSKLLAGALESMTPPSTEESSPTTLSLEIGSLAVTQGSAVVPGDTAREPIDFQDIHLNGSLRLNLANLTGDADITDACVTFSPLPSPLCLSLTGHRDEAGFSLKGLVNSGAQSANIELTGTLLEEIRGDGDLSLQNLDLSPLLPGLEGSPLEHPVSANVSFTVVDSAAQWSLSASAGETRLDASGSTGFGEGVLNAKVAGSLADVALSPPFVPIPVNTGMHFEATLDSPDHIAAALEFSQLSLLGLEFGGTEIRATRELEKLSVDLHLLRDNGEETVVKGGWNLDSSEGNYSLALTHYKFEHYTHLSPALAPLEGTLALLKIEGDVSLQDGTPQWNATSKATVEKLAFGDNRMQQLKLDGTLSGKAANVWGSLLVKMEEVAAGTLVLPEIQVEATRTSEGQTRCTVSARHEAGNGSIQISTLWPEFKELPDVLTIERLQGSFRGYNWTSANEATLSLGKLTSFGLTPLRLTHEEGFVEVAGGFEVASGGVNANLSLGGLLLPELLERLELPPIGGSLSGKVALNGTLEAPTLDVTFQLKDPAPGLVPFANLLTVAASYDGKSASLNVLGAMEESGAITADIATPLRLSLVPFEFSLPEDEPLHGQATVSNFHLALLRSFLPDLPFQGGVVDLSLEATGYPDPLTASIDGRVTRVQVDGTKAMNLSLAGKMDRVGLKLKTEVEWPGDNRVTLVVDAPRFEVLSSPDSLDSWLAKWREQHTLSLDTRGLMLNEVIHRWTAGGLVNAQLRVGTTDGGGEIQSSGWVEMQPRVRRRPAAIVGGKKSPRNRVHFEARYNLKALTIDSSGKLQNVQLGDLSPFLSGASIAGRADGTWSLVGPLSAPNASADLRLSKLSIPEVPFLEGVRVNARVGDGRGRANGRVSLVKGGTIRFDGSSPLVLSLSPFVATPRLSRARGEVTLSEVAVENFSKWLPDGVLEGGTIDGQAAFAGPLAIPEFKSTIMATGLTLPGLGTFELNLNVDMKGEEIALGVVIGQVGKPWVTLEGNIPAWHLTGKDNLDTWSSRFDSARHRLTLNGGPIPVESIWREWPRGGTLSLHMNLTHPPADFEIAFQATGFTLLEQAVQLDASLSSSPKGLATAASIMVEELPVLTLKASLANGSTHTWYEDPLQAPLHLNLVVTQGARLLLDRLEPLLGVKLKGAFAVEARASGSLSDLTAHLDASLGAMEAKGVPIDSAVVSADITAAGARAEVTVNAGARGLIEGAVELDSPCLHTLVQGDCDLTNAPIDGTLNLSGIDDELTRLLVPRGYLVDFESEGSLTVGGTVSQPDLTGEFVVDICRLKIPITGWDLYGVEIRVTSAGSRIQLDPVVLNIDKGSATLEGMVDLTTKEIRLNLKANRFPLLNRWAMNIFLDGEAGVKGTWEAPEIYGELVIPEGHVGELPMGQEELHSTEMHEDIVFADRMEGGKDPLLALFQGKPEEKQEQKTINIAGAVHLEIPGRLFVNTSVADLELAGKLGLSFAGIDPLIQGEIHTRRGKVEVFGRLFELERAKVEFTGSKDIDPRLDVLANFSISDVDLAAYGLEVGPESVISISVGGRVSDPDVSLSSSPTMAEEQIMTVLVMGQAKGDGVAGGNGNGAALLTGLLVAPLKGSLTEKLPVDTLNLRPGARGFEDAQVSAGRYLAPWLFVSYAYQFGAEEDQNRNEVHLEVRISRRILLESMYGDAGAGSFDLIYRITY